MQNARKGIVATLLLFLSFLGRGQDPTTIQNYINKYKDLAISEMQRTGVPASITLAQGITETLAGTSDLVLASNNHFGIKCKDNWTGETVRHDDDSRQECFRKYSTPEDSYKDHSNFLKGSGRYAALFNLDPTNYSAWAWGLKKAGYATNPRYPQIIIKLIEDYRLQDYTVVALNGMSNTNSPLAIAAQPKADVQGKSEVENKTLPILASVKQPVGAGLVPAEVQKIIEQPVYPQSEFAINDTKVIYARKGTPFLSIAQQYNVPLVHLFEFNDINETEIVSDDQLVYLQRKRKTGTNEVHIVKAGESLWDIAQSEAIRLETLMQYNYLDKNKKPAIGETLNLRMKAAAMPRLELRESYAFFKPSSSNTLSSSSVGNNDASSNFQSITYTVNA
jgi:LysM repeat protein